MLEALLICDGLSFVVDERTEHHENAVAAAHEVPAEDIVDVDEAREHAEIGAEMVLFANVLFQRLVPVEDAGLNVFDVIGNDLHVIIDPLIAVNELVRKRHLELVEVVLRGLVVKLVSLLVLFL